MIQSKSIMPRFVAFMPFALILGFTSLVVAQDQPGSPIPAAPAAKDGANPPAPATFSFDDVDTSVIKKADREKLDKVLDAYKESVGVYRTKMVDFRISHLEYLNYQHKTRSKMNEFRALRTEALECMEQAFSDGVRLLDFMDNFPPALKYAGENDVDPVALSRFLVTVCKHHYQHDTYDATMLYAGKVLFRTQANFPSYLFLGVARSAVCAGEFEFATEIYKSVGEENWEKVDRSMIGAIEILKSEWDKESMLIKKETEEKRNPQVKFMTSRGEFIVELYIDQAPSTVAHFINLVEDKFYDGLEFYQVVSNLLALTGDPEGRGEIGEGPFLLDEHAREDARAALYGSLLMVKIPIPDTSDFVPNTASTQFAISYIPLPSVAKNQTVFGRVIKGMELVGQFRRVDPTKEKQKGEVVLPADKILSATMIRRPEKLPEVQFVDKKMDKHAGHNHP